MNRRGGALLMALWLIVLLGALLGGAIARARIGLMASRNRVWLRRAEWAEGACEAILRARVQSPRGLAAVGHTPLGDGAWCEAELEWPQARINLNLADGSILRALVGNDSLTDAVLDWRDPDDAARPMGAEAGWYRARGLRLPRNGPFASVEELRLVRGFDPPAVGRLQPLLTVNGPGTIDLNRASAEVLAALPGLGSEAIATIESRRRLDRDVSDLSDLMGRLSPSGQTVMGDAYPDLVQQTATVSTVLAVHLRGGVDGTPIVARSQLLYALSGSQLTLEHRWVE